MNWGPFFMQSWNSVGTRITLKLGGGFIYLFGIVNPLKYEAMLTCMQIFFKTGALKVKTTQGRVGTPSVTLNG